MQDRNQDTSDRSSRPYRSNQDSESKLEQIKREVKSWFSDDDDDERQSDYYDSRGRYETRDQDRDDGRSRYGARDRDRDDGRSRYGARGQDRDYGRYRDYSDDGYRSSSRNVRSRHPSQRSDSDYERYGSDYYLRNRDRNYDSANDFGESSQPVRYTYSQYWLIPGPFAGTGPKGYQRSSDSLKEAVCDRLESDGRIDASEIEVEVDNCEVTLTGQVPSREQKRLAEDCADGVRGIKDVHNRLIVDSNLDSDTGSWISDSNSGSTGSYGSTKASGSGRGTSKKSSQAGASGNNS
jgi:osmotically-inducible protein OsmY